MSELPEVIVAVNCRAEELRVQWEDYLAEVREELEESARAENSTDVRARAFEKWCLLKLAGLQEIAERHNANLETLAQLNARLVQDQEP